MNAFLDLLFPGYEIFQEKGGQRAGHRSDTEGDEAGTGVFHGDNHILNQPPCIVQSDTITCRTQQFFALGTHPAMDISTPYSGRIITKTMKTKTIAAILGASALSLASISCESKQEEAREDRLETKADAIEDKADQTRRQGEKSADATENSADAVRDGNGSERRADGLENEADATRRDAERRADGLEESADDVRDAKE